MPSRASAEAFVEQWSKNCQVTMQFRRLGLSELLERILLAIVSARAADLLLLQRWNYIALWATLQLLRGIRSIL
jgi:hypothetical protein